MDCKDHGDCNLNRAAMAAMAKVAETDGRDEAKQARQHLFEHLIENKELKETFVAMSLLATISMLGVIKDKALETKLDKFEHMNDDEKKQAIKDFSTSISLKDLAPFLEFSWFGTIFDHFLSGLNKGPDEEVIKAIQDVMGALEHSKTGICETCGNLQHVRPVGKNGTDVCNKCWKKNPETLVDVVNQMLRQRLGPGAPIAVLGKKDELENLSHEEISKLIQQQATKEDITRFN